MPELAIAAATKYSPTSATWIGTTSRSSNRASRTRRSSSSTRPTIRSCQSSCVKSMGSGQWAAGCRSAVTSRRASAKRNSRQEPEESSSPGDSGCSWISATSASCCLSSWNASARGTWTNSRLMRGKRWHSGARIFGSRPADADWNVAIRSLGFPVQRAAERAQPGPVAGQLPAQHPPASSPGGVSVTPRECRRNRHKPVSRFVPASTSVLGDGGRGVVQSSGGGRDAALINVYGHEHS